MTLETGGDFGPGRRGSQAGYSRTLCLPCRELALACATVLLVVGCSTRKLPEDTGGERLPHTDRIRSTQPVFLISPNGQWLLFEEEGTPLQPELVLYSLLDESPTPIGNPDARGSHVPLLGATRWSEDGAVAWSLGGVVFELDTRRRPLEFVRIPDREDLPPWPVGPEPADFGLRVVRASSREVRLETLAPSRVLAVHRVRGVNEGWINLEGVTVSPDGSFASYLVVALRGGTFTAQSRGFLLDLHGESKPRLLADPMSDPVFHPRERILFAEAKGKDGRYAIYRWSY